MNVRAKFKCQFVQQFEGSHRLYQFNAVCADEVAENQRFHKYTPSGSLTITVDNPDVTFVPGQEYYLDFTPLGVRLDQAA